MMKKNQKGRVINIISFSFLFRDMLVYNSKKEGFIQDVLLNNIEKIILDFFQKKLERKTSVSEIDSRKNSMMYMKNILEDPEIPNDS